MFSPSMYFSNIWPCVLLVEGNLKSKVSVCVCVCRGVLIMDYSTPPPPPISHTYPIHSSFHIQYVLLVIYKVNWGGDRSSLSLSLCLCL